MGIRCGARRRGRTGSTVSGGDGEHGRPLVNRHASRDESAPGIGRAVAKAGERRAPGPPRLGAVLVVVCLVSAIVGWWLRPSEWALLAFGIAYVSGGIGPTITALAMLGRARLSIDLLMIVAAIGAALIGEWLEGAVLLFLFSFSNTLEAYAMFRTTRSVQALMRLRPSEAVRIEGGVEQRVAVEDLVIGDLLRIRPGELFPADGEVVEGTTEADEATITGESMPISKSPGSSVFAGTTNQRGTVVVGVTHAPGDTKLDKIIRLVQEAQADKPPTQRFVERWQQPYVLGVFVISAFVLALNWWILKQEFGHALYHAMVILVAASPCAVIAASPSVVLSAIARAARKGVLFKRGAHVETLGEIRTFAFDKTGTITQGRPELTHIWTTDGVDEDRLLTLAASLEHFSEHHLGIPIVAEAQQRGLGLLDVRDFASHPGQGVSAIIDGERIAIGRETLFASLGFAIPATVVDHAVQRRSLGETALIVVLPDQNTGAVIGVADSMRPDAPDSLAALRRLGIDRIVMLTGDHESIARTIGERIGADEVHADMMPEDKVREVKRLLDEHGRLVMVGDGVNDAPALASATIGIAMGGAGTEVALEVADVVLMRDDLSKLAFAVWLSRTARVRIRQNVAFALAMIGLLIVGSFFGLPLWLAVLGHEGSTVLVVLNGLRIFLDREGLRSRQ
ncbi:MAG: heavy metal translocating P-type ATPase [Phycisphaeraceae bacterium]|nr:MAG: heavy metal translocating P-type ATPase [Phycisphaeraceae bacterium]